MRRFAVLAFLLVFGLGMLWAQSDRATISGEVHDSTGAVVPGVKVQVINTGTNDVMNLTTNGEGRYVASNLVIGGYKVVFVKDGFKKAVRKDITLGVSQSVNLSIALETGGADTTVEVTGELPMLQTEDTKLTTNLNNKAVTDLPLTVSGGRSLSNFMFAYVPGVEGTDYDSHINGSVSKSKEVMIDGTSAVAQLGGYISESQPPMEGVQEFQVSTAGIGADEGRSGGGVFRYEMKSGSNAMHGSLFGFLHDKNLNALSANAKLNAQNATTDFNRATYLKKVDSLSNWGGSFGGPIKKDKLFYQFAFERYMASNWNLGAMNSTVPTDAMMGLNADGSLASYADLSAQLDTSKILGVDKAGHTIYGGSIVDPSTGLVFAGNLIPTSAISKTTAKILQLYHKYYAPESTTWQNNALPAASLPWNHITESSIKIDYNINDRHRVNGSFIYNDYPRILADQGGVWSPTAGNGGPFANSYWHETKSPSIRVADYYTITPTLVNSARATMNRFYNPSTATSQAGGWNSALGLNAGVGNFPKINFHGNGWYGNSGTPADSYTQHMTGLGSQFNDFYAANTYIYNDDLTWTYGHHTVKFGVEWRAMQFNNHPDSGNYSITFDPGTTGTAYNQNGSAFASFLLGDMFDGSSLGATDNLYGRRKSFSAFAEDTYAVSKKLTLDYAIRWDFNMRYKEKYGHWSNFNMDEMNSVTGLKGAYDYLTSGDQSFEKNQHYLHFSPHVGASYQVDRKTVARSSFSIFYVPLNANTWGGIPYQSTGNPGYYDINQTSGTTNWDNGWTGKVSRNQSPAHTQWGTVSIDPNALLMGNSMQWMAGVQRELPCAIKLDVSWIQSWSHHLHNGALRTNQPTIETYRGFLANGKLPSSYNGYFGNFGSNGGPWYAGLTPYPQAAIGWGNIFSVDSPLGNSTYKGLQISASKRAGHGVSFQGSYVWSRTRGDSDSSMSETWGFGSIQNIYDLASERKDIASFDVTHVVKGYVLYELPFGQGKALFGQVGNITNQIIGGWSLNAGFHYNTGSPMSIHSTNSYPGFGSVYVNLVSGCSMKNGSPAIGKQWINPNCLANPDATTGQLGTAGNFIEQLRYPGQASEDMSLSKAVSFGANARYKLSFRVDFFNVFNRNTKSGVDTNLFDYDPKKPTTSTFGRVTSYGGQGGRVGQIGARLSF